MALDKRRTLALLFRQPLNPPAEWLTQRTRKEARREPSAGVVLQAAHRSDARAYRITPEPVADLNWKIRAVADMNGDDKADLVWQHGVDGRVAVWLMDGTQLSAGIVIAQLADTNWQLVGPR